MATNFKTENTINKAVLPIIQSKIHPLATILTWSHYIELLSLKDIDEIQYYVNISIQQRLTRNEFKTEYIGQILKYMHYIDSNIKTITEDNTIGIIISKRNNEFYLEYCSDERVLTREYKIVN